MSIDWFKHEMSDESVERCNLILANSNVFGAIPVITMFALIIRNQIPLRSGLIGLFLICTQILFSYLQHKTERNTVEKHMRGVDIGYATNEVTLLYLDRCNVLALVVFVSYHIFQNVGFWNIMSDIKLIRTTAIAGFFLFLSDHLILGEDLQLLYTVVHTLWHAMIYYVLGMVFTFPANK